MRRFAVLGNPIEHSKSPEIHRAFAESCRHDIDYQKVLVEAGDFDRMVNDFFASGGIGLNVAAPFKGEAFAVAEVRSPDAMDAQAVNTLWRDDQGAVESSLPEPEVYTLEINGGRKHKLRPGDILGALTAGQELSADAVGKIDIQPMVSYVAIAKAQAKIALALINRGKIKGRQYRARGLG